MAKMRSIYFTSFFLVFASIFFYYYDSNPIIKFIFIISFVVINIYSLKTNSKHLSYIFIFSIMFNMMFYKFFVFSDTIDVDKKYKVKGKYKNGNILVDKIDGKFYKGNLFVEADKKNIENGNYIFEMYIEKKYKSHLAKIIKYDTISYEKYIKKLENRIRNYTLRYSEDYFSFFLSIVTGNKNFERRENLKKYSYCGISHLVVVSGLHFGIIMLILKVFLEKMYVPYIVRYSIIGIFMFFYLMMCRFQIPVMRAFFMAEIFILSKTFYEIYDIKKAFFIALISQTLINPMSIFNVSFQLSFVAVYVLIDIYPRLVKKEIKNKYLNLLCTGICIQFFLAPLTLYYFQQISFLGIFSNVLLSVYFVIMLGVFFINFLIGMISESLGLVLSGLSFFMYKIFVVYVELLSNIPFMSIKLDMNIKASHIIILYVILYFGMKYILSLDCLNLQRENR